VASGEVKVEGLAAFRKELKALEGDTNWNRELTRGMRGVATKAAGWARSEAQSMGGQQAHFASALFGRATATQARIEVAGERSPKGKVRANPAFWGRNSQGNWIGASWDVGIPGEGPYAINTAIFRHRDDLVEEIGDVFDAVIRQAFPDN